jgi:GT2 family glycosyltransferase
MARLITIMAVHNEDMYLPHSIRSLISACESTHCDWEQIIVLDRCTDGSEAIAGTFSKKHPNINVYHKKSVTWRHTYAENLQIGFKYAVSAKADYLAVVDADIVLEKNYFTNILTAVNSPRIASASGLLVTNPLHQNTFSRIYRAWELSYRIGFHVAAWGASRVYRMELLLNVGGFMDFASPDTELDIRLDRQGYRHMIVSEAKAYHIRDISIESSLNGQVRLGVSRNELGIPLVNTVLHGIFRLRPGLVIGHLVGALNEK